MKNFIKNTTLFATYTLITCTPLKSSGEMFRKRISTPGILHHLIKSGHIKDDSLRCIRIYNPEKDLTATIENLRSTKLDHLFKPDSHQVFVYQNAEGIKGICAFEANGKTGMLHIISVCPKRQKQGIGSALLYAVAQHLKNHHGATHLQLIAEESAKKFYTKSGFGPIGADTAEHMMIGKLS